MHSVPESEARAILGERLFLQDPPEWLGSKDKPWHQSVECGVLRSDGTRAGLVARIEFSYSVATKIRTFQFTIFKAQLQGLVRVYQLTISRLPKVAKDLHRLSHEHVGEARIAGRSEWNSWTFDQAMTYFCSQANLSIEPPIDNPEELRLKP